jgi:hypothetical protein
MPQLGTVMTWGLAAIPLTYDPPVSDPSELQTVVVTPAEEGVKPYRLQAEPARRLPRLSGFPIAVVTSESSWLRQQDPGTVAYLRQVGADVEHIKLWERGVRGNGHLMMGEKNNREVAELLFEWLAARVEQPAAVSAT